MTELFGLMSLLDADAFGDQEGFLERYGGGRNNPMPSTEQVQHLQVRPAQASLGGFSNLVAFAKKTSLCCQAAASVLMQ